MWQHEPATPFLKSYLMQIPKPSAIRNYLYEYVLIGLVAAVVTLFYMYVDVQKNVNKNGTDNAVIMQQIIKDNTNALQQFLNYGRQNFRSQDKKPFNEQTPD